LRTIDRQAQQTQEFSAARIRVHREQASQMLDERHAVNRRQAGRQLNRTLECIQRQAARTATDWGQGEVANRGIGRAIRFDFAQASVLCKDGTEHAHGARVHGLIEGRTACTRRQQTQATLKQHTMNPSARGKVARTNGHRNA
jgi:hypothetical protein